MRDNYVYNEVIDMLDTVPYRDYLKIPPGYIQFLNNNKNNAIGENKKEKSREAYCLFLKIYLEYIADDEEKNIINEILKMNSLKKEEEKKAKYNTENLFKKTNYENKINGSLVTTKETWYDKVFKRIKSFLKNKV